MSESKTRPVTAWAAMNPDGSVILSSISHDLKRAWFDAAGSEQFRLGGPNGTPAADQAWALGYRLVRVEVRVVEDGE